MRFLLLSFALLLGACTFQTTHRGYVFPENLDEIVAGIKTTSDLQDKIGDPLARTIYGDTIWIYYGTDENYRGPLRETYTNKTVLLALVRDGRVVKTQILHDDDLPQITIDNNETQIPAAIELNAIQELFNNIGRFSPAGLGQ